MNRSTRPHRVAVLIRTGFIPFELGIPHRIFGIARDAEHRPLYEVVTCTPGGPGLVRSDSDVLVQVEHGPEALETADTVVVTASHTPGPDGAEEELTPELAAALARIRPGARLMSICTGAFVLAAAGLLDGRPATTHWLESDRFRQLYPRVALDPDVLYTDDGDVLTSAGVASGVDLCLHVLRRDHGAAVAQEVARRTVVPPHRDGGQAQYIRRPVSIERVFEREAERADAAGGRVASTAAARSWALDRLDEPLTLSDLARHAAMSVRTFTRRFRDETGESPAQWLTRQRVEHARTLLETTELPVEQVARRCGFGTAQSLRAHVQAVLGVTPSAYRRTFHRAA
ncbi:GlxA family transcriptional regulator [Promicromonospora thailandica]|uniref:Transcriptional regulator, AraC family with amidase-like domain n=1 Tax=Promicromonospora thailandica TaxID=765201 RepID=A0A9X2G022_9MICO|nr:helix-turn-helix domain-containing protein [Promicromonospora thailandica]MCP2264344.1 transcriptional regulator, AraC family with amidase-like domain [Promicromonospora thailandica]BFF20965.1 helix-turn-helix domain-containing protein [Promicromonospora thailandica]